MDMTSEWCYSFILVCKTNGKAKLCLDLPRLSKTLTRPVHRGPTLNDILPRLPGIKYLTLIYASSDYHNLKLDERLLYLTIFSCPCGRYRYKRLPFGTAPAGDTFQKIDGLFSSMPNAF